MVWKRADEADITAYSDADGYSESLTVVDNEEVHVDSHANASASPDPVVYSYTWNDKYISNTIGGDFECYFETTYEDPNGSGSTYFSGPNNTEIEAEFWHEDSGTYDISMSIYYDGTYESATLSDVGNGDHRTITRTTDGQPEGFRFGNSDTNIENCNCTLRIKMPISTSASVLTDDIHK